MLVEVIEGLGVMVLAGVVVNVIVGVKVSVAVGKVVFVIEGVGFIGVDAWQAATHCIINRDNNIRGILRRRRGFILLYLVAQMGRVTAAAPYPTTDEVSPVAAAEVS